MTRRAAAAFVLTALVVLGIGLTFDRLYDTDSYLHMALARHLAEAGPRAGIGWARFSVLADGFGDKELLFHALLLPFATLLPVVRGGVLAIAAFAGALAALLAVFGARHARAGAWTPLLVLLGSADVLLRILRVRPEILALALFLVALDAAARRRFTLLAVVSILFPLSYVAVPAYVLLFAILFGAVWWRDGRPEWRLLLVPLIGAAAGLLLHPQFPANVRLVKIVALDVLRAKDSVEAGTEFQPPLLIAVLTLNIGWLLSLIALWRSRRPGDRPADDGTARRTALFFGLAALVFTLLHVSMGRFSLYAVPFATIAFFAALRTRGEEAGPRVRLPFHGSLPTPVALAVALAAGLAAAPAAVTSLDGAEVFRPGQEREWAAIRPLVPEGAKVAAAWGNAEVYAWAFPRAAYLNLFDPTLMAVPFPRLARVQRGLWEGSEPDPAFAAYELLDSPFILYHRNLDRGTLEARLLGDPRVSVLHRGEEMLARVDPDRNGAFVLDWRTLPAESALDAPAGEAWNGAPRWPRVRTARGRRVEGYVDAARLPGPPCRAFAHDFEAPAAGEARFEFSPWAAGALSLDGRLLALVPAGTRAVLGKGVLLPVALSAGPHRFVATTCQTQGRNGFYLLRR